MTTTKLPELPEPDFSLSQFLDGKCIAHAYTADQLRAYGEACRATAPAVDEDAHNLVLRELLQRCEPAIEAWKREGQITRTDRDNPSRFHMTVGPNHYRAMDLQADIDTITATCPATGRDGFVMVPREATEAMVQAGCDQHQCEQGDPYYSAPDLSEGDCRAIYAAMLAAAQPPAPRSES